MLNHSYWHILLVVCVSTCTERRKSQHLMRDGQSLGIAATTIVGCPVYAASQGILALILNLDNREQSTMGDDKKQFLFFAGNWLWYLHSPELQRPKHKEAHKYLAVCSKAHRRNLQEA